MPAYFDRYIYMTDDVTVEQALQTSLNELEQAPLNTWQMVGSAIYEPGKWTINDILQHIIDTERVFCYRALSFARGEKDVRPYDEHHYGKMAKATQRTLEHLLEEAIAVRKATLRLFRSFDEEMRKRIGEGFKGPYSVHSIGFILAGHQRWHFRIIQERYLPLVLEGINSVKTHCRG